MATLLPYTPLSATRRINGTDCLGDSRLILNTNFQNIETFTHTLSTSTIKNTTISTNNPPTTTRTHTLSVYNSNGNYIGFIPIYN